jgi:hypothetical protein
MKKSVAIILLLMLLTSILMTFPIILSQDETETTTDTTTTESSAEGFEAGYECLADLLITKGYDDLTVEETAFSLLAMGYDSSVQGELRSQLADLSNDNRCWPGDDDCTVKETALALLALNHVNQPTDLVESWLIAETTEPDELNWYLQVDSDVETECTVAYEGGSKEINIESDKRITGAGGDCLSSAMGGYWIQIDDDCYDDTFEISCEDAFITSTAYKFGSGVTTPYYISSITNSAPADGKTTETVSSLCFTKDEDNNDCDYEGTLWATLALQNAGKDISAYIPYLVALAPNNERYMPSAFLYMLTRDSEYFTDLINKQRAEGYWQTSTSQRYYDTATGLLALYGISADQGEDAIDWLLETQPSSGCWNNARDTAFILYSASPKNPALASTKSYCVDQGYSCVSSEQTCEDGLGTVMPTYECTGLGASICCSREVAEDLPDVVPGGTDENECEERNYNCKAFCGDNEDEVPYECSGIEACCAPAAPKERASLWWVWLLAILIILLILAIIYRNQVKIWLFRIKSKYKKGPVPQGQGPRPGRPGPGIGPMFRRPGPQGPGRLPLPRGAPGQGPRGMPARPMRPRPGMPPQRQNNQAFPKENILQETLRKLKEMGKK